MATPTTPNLKPGDKVSFTLARQEGRNGLRFSSREGTLVFRGPETSEVKFKNGRTAFVATDSLRPIGQQNALTENFLKLAEDLKSE
jgi:hypothetical protein